MPWGSRREQVADKIKSLGDAAKELGAGNVRDAAGIVKTALTENTDPDERAGPA